MAINNTVQFNRPKNALSNPKPLFESVKKDKFKPDFSQSFPGFTTLMPSLQRNVGQSTLNTPSQPVQAPKPSSATSYKGVAISGTSQSDIQNQMRGIDSRQGLQSISAVTPSRAERVPEPTKSRGLFTDVSQSLARKGTETSSAVAEAQKAYEKSVADLRQFRESVAQMGADVKSDPVSGRVMQGRAQALQQANAEKLKAYQDAVGQAQTGIQLGQAQQSLEQSALGTVAGLTQPSATAFGQTVFDPASGQFTGGGGNLDPQTQASSLAQQVVNGQLTYEQALQSLSYAGNVGTTFLNQAITGIGGDPLQLQAQGAGQQTTLQTIPALYAAETAAEGIKNTIQNHLAQNPQLNPSELVAGNLAEQLIQNRWLGDPQYQTLFNYINEYTNTLAPILGVGGSATNLKTEIAQSFINGAASGANITEVLNNISTLARQKVADLESGARGGSTTAPQSGGFQGELTWDNLPI